MVVCVVALFINEIYKFIYLLLVSVIQSDAFVICAARYPASFDARES